MKRKFRHSIDTQKPRSIGRIATVLAVLLLAAGAFFMAYRPLEDFASILKREGPSGIPVPFVNRGNGFAKLEGSLVQIGGIGSGGSIPVYMVELSDATSADLEQVLNENAIYLVKTSATAETVPFDFAFPETNGHEPDFFLYQYSDGNATQEIANRNAVLFAQRFPGPFGASDQAWINEVNFGNPLTSFEQNNGINFEPTHLTGSIRFAADSLYAVIVNEPGGSLIRLHATSECGDGWKMDNEACDDGNVSDGDGCSAVCDVESGYSCTGNPSTCTPIISSSSSSFSESSMPSSSSSSEASSSAASSESSSQSSMQSSSSSTPVTIDMNEPAYFVTHTDSIKNFTQNPDNVAVFSGLWSDDTIWSAGHVPVTGENVRIESGVTVQYDFSGDVTLDAVGVKGNLIFLADSNTKLKAGNIQVYRQGYLEVGTEQNPIGENVKAELIIADKPLDIGTLANPGTDPSQWGTALISYGKVRMHGAAKPKTWIRLAEEARSGSTVIMTEEPMQNWLPGETIILPDTRQPKASRDGVSSIQKFGNMGLNPQWEERVIDHVDGNAVYFTQPLKFGHSGARLMDGTLAYLPHVGVLNRNIIVRSENPNGTRGHAVFTERSDADIRYARFSDLGRSDAFSAAHNTVFTNGVLTQIGTNQIGRYAVHFHHLDGPVNPTNTGYQFKFIGNTVDRAKKWNVTVHGTDYGLLTDNVIYDGQGGGFVSEDGTEIGNEFIRNFVVRMIGTHIDGKEGTEENDLSRGGSGFWFRRSGNIVRDNVVADNTYSGYYYSSYFLTGPVRHRNFRGADRTTDGTWMLNNPFGQFENNEAYGMSTYGLWIAFTTGDDKLNTPQSLFKDSAFWHIGHDGVLGYHTVNTVYDNVTLLFDPSADDRSDFGAVGFRFANYFNRTITIQRSRVEGGYHGLIGPNMDASTLWEDVPTIVKDSTFQNYINIRYYPPGSHDYTFAGSIDIRNVKFGQRSNHPLDINPRNIVMDIESNMTVLFGRSTVRVFDYNQVPGDDFQVFFRHQSGGFIMPKTDNLFVIGDPENGRFIGSPEAGLTNQQNWDRYRLVVGGRFTPCLDRTTHPEIDGYTCPILPDPPTSTMPMVAIAMPWPGHHAPLNFPLQQYYTVVNNYLPAGMRVVWQLDDGAPRTFFINNDMFYNVPEGPHTLRAWIGDENTLVPMPGTLVECIEFAVDLPNNGTQTFPMNGLCPAQYYPVP